MAYLRDDEADGFKTTDGRVFTTREFGFSGAKTLAENHQAFLDKNAASSSSSSPSKKNTPDEIVQIGMEALMNDNYDRAFILFKQAAEQGNITGMIRLGSAYKD